MAPNSRVTSPKLSATARTCASRPPHTPTRATSKPCIASKKMSSSISKSSPAEANSSPRCTPTSCTSTWRAPTRIKKIRVPGRSSSGCSSLAARTLLASTRVLGLLPQRRRGYDVPGHGIFWAIAESITYVLSTRGDVSSPVVPAILIKHSRWNWSPAHCAHALRFAPNPRYKSRHLFQRATTTQKVHAMKRPHRIATVIVISVLCVLNWSRAETKKNAESGEHELSQSATSRPPSETV
jgi:hypothetical protein